LSGDLDFDDNVKAKFGDGDDLQIYHSGTNSHVKDAGTGSLMLQGDSLYLTNAAGNLTYFYGSSSNGAAQLRYGNNAKLATTSTGIDVTGTVTADGLTVDGDVVVNTGAGTLTVDSFGGSSVQVSSNGAYKHISTLSSGYHLFEVNSKSVAKFNNNGDISFYEDTGTTPKFFWDASAERLGLGTSSPSSPLHIEKASGNVGIQITSGNSSDTYINFGDSADTNAGLIAYEHDNNAFAFRTNGSERMRIDSSGNVGIGTSSPDYKLDIESDTAQARIRSNVGNAVLRIEAPDTKESKIYFGDNAASSIGTIEYHHDNNYMSFDTVATERMRIDSNGRVGIGTSSPTNTLDVEATQDTVANILSNGSYAAKFSSTTAGNTGRTQGILLSGANGNNRGVALLAEAKSSGNSHDFVIATSASSSTPTERMRIDSSGNVGIGTNSPNGKFTISDDSSRQFEFYPENSADTNLIINYDRVTSTYQNLQTRAATHQFLIGSNERMRIDSSGNALFGKSSADNTTVGTRINGNGLVSSVANGDVALLCNRKSSDGDIALFRKDGNTVGSIGSNNGDLLIGTGTTGLRFLDSSTAIIGRNTNGSTANGTIDLGNSSNRFKDAYFSGTVNANAFVGDGSGLTGISGGGAGGSTAITMNDNVKINLGNTSTTVGELYNDGSTTILNSSLGSGQPFELRANDFAVVSGEAFSASWGFVTSVKLHAEGYNPGANNWSNWCLQTGYNSVTINGNLAQNVDNSNDIGNSYRRWDDIYATNGTIQTSDRNEKQDIEELSDAEQRVAFACKGLMRKFRWKDSVEEKGDDARIHFGIIAQDLQAAFEAEGLDAGKYAMFISTTWWEAEQTVPAEDGAEEQTEIVLFDTLEEAPEGAVERTRMGVRYSELLAFIIAAT
jgi:hypothetical protein